jgi:predicted dehydrogenase
MPVTGSLAEAIVWTDAAHLELSATVLESVRPHVQTIAVAGPPTANPAELARRLGCTYTNDLRQLLVDHPAAFVLLATAERASPEELSIALRHGSTVLVIEPPIGNFEELRALRRAALTAPLTPTAAHTHAVSASPAEHPSTALATPPAPRTDRGRIVSVPTFDASPGWTAAADPIHLLGPTRQISIHHTGPRHDSSLFSRLWDSWQLTLQLAGRPQTIDASLLNPSSRLPDDLPAIAGHLVAHARFTHGCAAAVCASDRTGTAARTLHLIADGGSLHVTDLGYQLHDAQGQPLDRAEPPEPPESHKSHPSWAHLIAHHWLAILNRPQHPLRPDAPLADDDWTLACCMACLLSARTGQPENPGKLLEMHQRP